jgi:putative MATE family efflux protein
MGYSMPSSAHSDDILRIIGQLSNDGARSGEPGAWATIREAIRGSHVEYTTVSIGRAIVLPAVPMVLELVLESVFALVDVFFVARLGADSVATVGVTEAILSIVYATASGLCIGATAVVARRIGERDRDGAARAAVQAIALGVIVAVPLGALGAAFAPQLLGTVMGAGPDVLQHVAYARIMFGFNGVILMLFLINAVFRGAGDPAIAMRVLWIANAINICLDPCLIFGLGPFPRLGVAGAAVATTTGRTVGMLLQLFVLWKGTERLAIGRRHLRLVPEVMLNMVRLSGSAVAQSLVITSSWLGLIRILSSFGSDALAGYTIAIRIVVFALMPSWGLANAAATLVGQNLGAGRPDRAEISVWRTCFYNAAILLGISAVLVVFARPIVSAFSRDPSVGAVAISGLRIIAGGFLFYAYGFVLTQAFNGAGDTLTPTLINLFCFWVFEVPLAWVLANPVGAGPAGVFFAIALSFSAMGVVSAVLFRRGRWKTLRV